MAERSRDFGAASPEEPSLDNIDAMLENVNEFIEGVYRDLSLYSPRRSVEQNSAANNVSPVAVSQMTAPPAPPRVDGEAPSKMRTRGAISLSSPSRNEIKSERENTVVSPSRQKIDAEIDRINRFCDTVDRNLQSIGYCMNNWGSGHSTLSSIGGDGTDAGSNISVERRARPAARPTSSRISTNSRGRRRRSNATTVTDVIDLSDIRTPVNLRRRPNNNVNHDLSHDDVILVSSDLVDVVDLCTPGRDDVLERPRLYSPNQLSRRRLCMSPYGPSSSTSSTAVSTVRTGAVEEAPASRRPPSTRNSMEGGDTSVRRRQERRRTISSSLMKTASSTADTAATTATTASTDSGRVPYMCPVCMESMLNRQPMTTKCGHIFCGSCIHEAIRLTHKCPMCTTRINARSLIRVYL